MGIIRSAFTIGVFTLFSRFTGFVRECVMAFCLGAGTCSDALLVALRISNTFRRIFAEGAFNASFLPRFSKVLNKKGKDYSSVLLSDILSVLLIILVPFSVIVIMFFPSFLKILVSGFNSISEKFELTVILGRICFPYLIFISITSLFCGALNALNKFALSSAIYSMLSVFTTFGLFAGYFLNLSDFITVHIVSICALVSGIIQSCILLRSIKKNGFKIKFRLPCWTNAVKDIMKNMVPGIIGAGVWQLNLFIDMTISSYLPTGTITCINLADRLNQFPLGTLGIALSTALLPLLSKLIGTKEYDMARKELENGLAFAFFFTFFATSVLIALSDQSVSVAFQRGMFDVEQVRITSSAVIGFAIGLPAYVLTKVFSTVYFAMEDTKSPVIFGMISVVLNGVLLFILVPFFKYFGLAICTSLSAISNAIMLIHFSNKKMKIKLSKGLLSKILSQLIAALVTYFFLSNITDLYWNPDIGRNFFKWLVYSVFLGGAVLVYFVTAVVCMYISKHKQWKLWEKEAWYIVLD